MLIVLRAGLRAAVPTLAAVICALLLIAPAAPAATTASSWNQALRKAAQNFQRQINGTKPAPAPAPAPAPTPAPAPAPPPAPPTPPAAPADTTSLADAERGDAVQLAAGTTLVVGEISRSGTTVTLTDATLQIGDVVVGTGVDGTAAGGDVALTDGTFTVARTLTDQRFEIAPGDPLTYDLDAAGGTQVSGELVSTGAAASPAALRTFAATAGEPDVTSALPPAPKGKSFRFGLKLNGDGSTTVRVFLGADEVIYGRIRLNGSYLFELKLPFDVKGKPVLISGAISGSNILQPIPLSGIKGAITGDIELVDGVFLTGGEIVWDKDGFALSGGARVECREGGLAATLAGRYEDAKNWSLNIGGGVTGGQCTVSDDLKLPAGDITGTLEVADGAVNGLFEVGGKISTTLLPDGVDEWDARFRFVYGSEQPSAANHIAFFASAGIGTAQGRINFDGTFGLNADFAIPFSAGNDVAFDGDINRTTPNGPVTYDVGGSLNVAIGSKASLGGSVRLTNTSLALAGRLRVACPIDGDIGGEVSAEIPLTSANRDWSVGFAGGAGADGCGMTKDFGLGPNSGASGSLKSVGGKLEIALDADATIETTVIPTKTSFSVGFGLRITPGTYAVRASGSTEGAGFSADIQSNGSYELAFNLDDLALGGVSLGAKGSIKRTAPSAGIAYSISGGLTGKAKIWDNLYFLGGSLGIDSTGGLTFSGTIRQLCNAGYIDASASGRIKSVNDFAFEAKGLASKCRIGNGALFDGSTFFASIENQNGKILYNAGLGIARLNLIKAPVLIIGDVSTWLTGVSGSISNTCDGCYERGVSQLKFEARAHAAFQTVSQITKTVNQVVGWIPFVGSLIKPVTTIVNNVTTTCTAATAYGTVEVKGLVVKKITIGLRNPQFGLLTLPVQGALTIRLNLDLEQAFTSGGGGTLGELPAVQLPPLGSGGPVPGWGC
ncbi:hypothetical protein LRS13_08395 [Svornostia abyssi]|uniref:Uncharacterized protein n=1 Tax=Svornostia abyssi TaxID=2898438 RepID=A0ABY5PLF1_9ACTN|nr:hypothetical protein LRS13_08395 [Parviterribacteraceae bacterium J379]